MIPFDYGVKAVKNQHGTVKAVKNQHTLEGSKGLIQLSGTHCMLLCFQLPPLEFCI
jgi:hypothetical protein